jgi:hypothetical protein
MLLVTLAGLAWATAGAAPTAVLAAERMPGRAYPVTAATIIAFPAIDPFEAIMTKVETVATGIAKLSTPVAILGIVLVLLMILFAPLLPEVAQQHKGYIIRALLITAVISIIPELVKAFATLGA